MRSCLVTIALLCLAPSLAGAQLHAAFGPRGEITELRVGEVVYFTNVAVSLPKPGWAGSLVDQRAADPASVKTATADGATVYTMTLSGGGAAVQLREVVRVSAERVALEYEVTPEQEVAAEVVMVQGFLPAAVHAGKTRYVVADPGLPQGLLPAEQDPLTHVIVGGRSADWVAFVGPGDSALRVTPTGLALQVQDDRKWSIPAFDLLATSPGGRLPAGKTIRFALAYTADTPARIEADIREAARADLTGLKLSDDRPLKINHIAADRQKAETFETVELRADLAATYANPFDPDEITVDAEVATPDGKTLTLPGFYYVPLRREMKLGSERLPLAGPPDFRVRYTPALPGRHRLALKVTDRRGTVRSAPIEITATPGRQPGFIRIAKESPLYFAFDDGRPFFAVGENLCWSWNNTPLTNYAAWLKGLGAAGGNWARLFLSTGEKGQEWSPPPTPRPGMGAYLGLGKYALDNAWRLDEILRLAHENGVHLMFCLGSFYEFTEGGFFNEGCWISNPYNAKNGGPCAKPEDFWTSARARKLYQQRLRYLLARWGHSPNLFAWEFWNEVPSTAEHDAWVAEMAAYVKRHDPNRHLVSTTYGSPAVWRCPDVDFTMKHVYGQAGNIADFTPLIVSQAREALAFNKPYLQAEFGIDWQTDDSRWDPRGTGLNLHNGAWASLLSGAAGTSMLWYWDSYVHPNNLYGVLTPVRKFADTVDWAGTRFVPLAHVEAELPADKPERFSDLTLPATLEWGKTPSAAYTASRDGSIEGGPIAMTLGSPKRWNPEELYSQITWRLDLPQPGKVVVHLGQVSSAARLRIAVDGEVKLDRPLSAGEPGQGPWKTSRYLEQYKIWVSSYDEEIPIEVPAGRHDLTLANTDGDWLQVTGLTLPGYRSSRYPDVNALGLAGDRLLLLWVQNRESTWRAEYDGKQPHELRGLHLTAPVASPGAWRVEWWDTFKGEVIRRDLAQAEGGKLRLAVPDFARDLAARVERSER